MTVNRSIIVVIALYVESRSFDSGKGPTKSIPIASHGWDQISKGFSNPNGRPLSSLLHLQTMQEEQYFSISAAIVFHHT